MKCNLCSFVTSLVLLAACAVSLPTADTQSEAAAAAAAAKASQSASSSRQQRKAADASIPSELVSENKLASSSITGSTSSDSGSSSSSSSSSNSKSALAHSMAKRDVEFSKRGVPRFVGKRQAAPRFIGKRPLLGQIGESEVAPWVIGIGEDEQDVDDKRQMAPRFIGKRQAPRFIGKRDFLSGFEEKRQAPTGVIEDVPEYEFIKRQMAPRFIGKRPVYPYATGLSNKRSDDDGDTYLSAQEFIQTYRKSDPYFMGKRGLTQQDDEGDEEAVLFDDNLLDASDGFGKRGVPRFVGKRGVPRFVGKRGVPRFVGKRGVPRFVGKRGVPRFVGKRGVPRFVGKRGVPRFVGKRGVPRFVGKRGVPRFVGKRGAPRFVGKRGVPRFVGKRGVPRFVGKRGVPRFVGKRGVPRFVGKRGVPRFVGKRGVPRFVGKRGVPRFVGKRDFDVLTAIFEDNNSDGDYENGLTGAGAEDSTLRDLPLLASDLGVPGDDGEDGATGWSDIPSSSPADVDSIMARLEEKGGYSGALSDANGSRADADSEDNEESGESRMNGDSSDGQSRR